jgi:hypothetical protein
MWLLRKYHGMVWTDLNWLRMGTSSCEHSNQPTGALKCWEVLEKLHN